MGNLLSNIFDLQSINVNLDGKTKEMVFVELINMITASYPEFDCESLLAAIVKRDEQLNSGIGFGVAVPHAICRGITKTKGAIGISKRGLDYGSLDNKPVHVVFLIAIREKMDENDLRVLNTIFRLTQSEAITSIKAAKNAEEIYNILTKVHLT